jgi:hypothetical protein
MEVAEEIEPIEAVADVELLGPQDRAEIPGRNNKGVISR